MNCNICGKEASPTADRYYGLATEVLKHTEKLSIDEVLEYKDSHFPVLRHFIEVNFLGGDICQWCRTSLTNRIKTECLETHRQVEIFATEFVLKRMNHLHKGTIKLSNKHKKEIA